MYSLYIYSHNSALRNIFLCRKLSVFYQYHRNMDNIVGIWMGVVIYRNIDRRLVYCVMQCTCCFCFHTSFRQVWNLVHTPPRLKLSRDMVQILLLHLSLLFLPITGSYSITEEVRLHLIVWTTTSIEILESVQDYRL